MIYKIIFYDFETKTNGNGVMFLYYCVIQKVCKKCDKIDFVSKDGGVERVECCGERQFVFEGDDFIDNFCDFLFQQHNSVWVAHNGARFDTTFILHWLLEQNNSKLLPFWLVTKL